MYEFGLHNWDLVGNRGQSQRAKTGATWVNKITPLNHGFVVQLYRTLLIMYTGRLGTI